MSRAYLFTLTGEQVDGPRDWVGHLEVRSRLGGPKPKRGFGIFVAVIRGRAGYRLRKVTFLPDCGTSILHLVSSGVLGWGHFGPRSGETYLGSIHAVRAFLQMGGFDEWVLHESG